jgi:gentisate 1,2-dioxygenase
MAAPTTTNTEMDAFYQMLESKHMNALWRRRPDTGGRNSAAPYAPARWRWSDLEPIALRALELVRPGRGEGERRAITLHNPSIPASGGATHSLTAAVQVVGPGDVSPSHRHVAAAIRFGIRGEGTVTIVNGEPVPIRPGDFLITPSLSWHGHISKGTEPMMWMDSLDAPLVGLLRVGMSQEPYPDEIEPATKAIADSHSRWGIGHLKPVWHKEMSPVSPLAYYPWEQSEEALHEMAKIDASPFDDIAFEYTNPLTGSHVMPTMGCWIQMLRPGINTKAHRHSSSQVYHVFRGHGATIVDGLRLEWEQGDFFALPPYAWHEHVNGSSTEEVVLFSTTDTAVLEPLNLYFEDAYEENDGHQKVTGTFEEHSGSSNGGSAAHAPR